VQVPTEHKQLGYAGANAEKKKSYGLKTYDALSEVADVYALATLDTTSYLPENMRLTLF
jgi:hypothetical protein